MNTGISAHTTVTELVDIWLKQLRAQGRLENTTINEYERVLRKLVVPGLGDFHLHELTTERIDTLLAELATQSVNRQRKAKVVIGAMLDVAALCGAVATNPVRGSMSVRRPKPETRELTLAELESVRKAVNAWMGKERPGPKASSDMADVIDLMVATGLRIGEVLALRWSDVDLDAGRLAISGTVKTESGKGTYRKTLANTRTVVLAEFAVGLLERRRHLVPDNANDAVLPTRNGTWHQVNNVERRWRQIRSEAGLEWLTPHDFRHNARREA